MKNNFDDIEDEWNWYKVKLSEGNPYVVDDFVRGREMRRNRQDERTM